MLMCAPCMLQDEMIAYVRRKSAAFSRGRSKYRGVSGQAGRWEARIGAYCGRKNVSASVTKCGNKQGSYYHWTLSLNILCIATVAISGISVHDVGCQYAIA